MSEITRLEIQDSSDRCVAAIGKWVKSRSLSQAILSEADVVIWSRLVTGTVLPPQSSPTIDAATR
nr:hypothetical protein Itr_chr06CG11510 [Ipomoea trifida]GMD03599.1 hypothetical protein Iba_chr06aCG10410 [Ipomoea batatas]